MGWTLSPRAPRQGERSDRGDRAVRRVRDRVSEPSAGFLGVPAWPFKGFQTWALCPTILGPGRLRAAGQALPLDTRTGTRGTASPPGPDPPRPCPALPCPALPCPALPCHRVLPPRQ